MNKILLFLIFAPLAAFGQSYPSPTYKNLTVINSTTTATVTPGTPINVFVNPGDTGHASDFAIAQSNPGSHTSSSNSAFSISSLPAGSGVAGPGAADIGLTLSNLKANWDTSAVLGEIDGMYIVNRQGSGSTSGILIDSGVVSGFGNLVEGVSRQYAPTTQAVVLGMDTQLGSIQTGASGPASSVGFVATAQTGTLGSGLLVQSNAGAGWTNAITVSANSGGGNTFSVTPAGVVTSTGETVGASGATFTLNDTSGAGMTHEFLQSAGVTQWDIQKSGANNLLFQRYVSGSAVDNPININNSTGLVTISDGLTMNSGAITPVQTSGIVGTTTNNNANAGSVGEFVSNSATGVSLTSNVAATVTSVSLTAGDWDCSGSISFASAGTTVPSFFAGGINTSSALPALPDSSSFNFPGLTWAASSSPTFVSGRKRFSLASTTTVFLVAVATFTTSTMTVGGIITCRRVR